MSYGFTPKICDTGVEALYCGALQRPAPYYAMALEPVDNGPGRWNYLKVGIYQRPEADIKTEGYSKPQRNATDVKIGEYVRNYSSLMRTFHPFQLRGKWYALYSKDYTSTRIMSLPDCKDLGGEERDSWGFCPTDFWVPPLSYIEDVHPEKCPRYKSAERKPDYTEPCTCQNDEYQQVWHFPDRVHGFVAGCVWGDDSSWKIEYLDLSRADEGIIKREDRFGYIEMPAHLDLDKAIDLDAGDGYMSLKIATESHYDLETGKKDE